MLSNSCSPAYQLPFIWRTTSIAVFEIKNQSFTKLHTIFNLLLIPYVSQVTAIMGRDGCGTPRVSLANMEARILAAQHVLVNGSTNTLVDSLCNGWATMSRLTNPAIVRVYSKVRRDSGKANDMYCAHALAGRSQLTMKEVLLNATFVFRTTALAFLPCLQ